MKIIKETERLILREILAEDCYGLFELESDPDVHRFLGNKYVKDIDKFREAIKYIRQQFDIYGIERWAIIEKKTNNFIGWSLIICFICKSIRSDIKNN